jgi:hypothetical protein
MSRSWPQVPLEDLLIEQKVRVGVFDADGLPLLGVSNTKDFIERKSRELQI